MNKQSGFTLIELLVVIAIIGILSSVVLTSLNTARTKARDAKRLSDIKQLQLALEFYYDVNGAYPEYSISPPTCPSGWALSHSSYITCWNDLEAKLKPYIARLPLDPLNGYPPTYVYNAVHYMAKNIDQGYIILMDPELLDSDSDMGCYGTPWYCVGVNF